MRNREIPITIRVTQKEKDKFLKEAKKAGLNLSSYLRMSGLKEQIKPLPNLFLYAAICDAQYLQYYIDKLTKDEILEKLKEMSGLMANAYCGKTMDDDGDNEDLGD